MIWRLNPLNQFENTHLNGHGDGGASTDDAADIVGGSNGRTTAVVHKGNSRALNLADDTILGDTDMGAMNQEAASVIGNVGAHGTESSVASKGEAGQATEVEVSAVDVDQLLLEVASQLIAAQRGAQKGVLGSVSLGREGLDGLGLQVGVGDGAGESGLDHLVKASRRGGGSGSLLLGGLGGRLRGLLHGLEGRWCLLVLSTDGTDGGD